MPSFDLRHLRPSRLIPRFSYANLRQAHLLWEQKVADSNPVSPTITLKNGSIPPFSKESL